MKEIFNWLSEPTEFTNINWIALMVLWIWFLLFRKKQK
jgi:hypothetical protein